MPKYPFHVQLHLTDRCNLKCKHCYEGERKTINEWDYNELTKIIDMLNDTFVKWDVDGEISLVGGEPVMWESLPDLLYYIREKSAISRIAILTNGTIITENLKKAILETRPAVQLSIDGVNEEKHDAIRGMGNYRKALQSIRWYIENGIDVYIHYVISKDTVPITKDFIDYMESLGIKQITFSRVVPIGSSEKSKMLKSHELKNVLSFLNEMNEELERSNSGMRINTTRPLWACFGKSGRCPVGIQTITILPNGDVLPCRRLPIIVGNIKESNLFDIWYNSEVLWNLRERKNFDKCGSCSNLENCGGGRCIAYAVSGNYLGKDPQCWI